jgi:polysaccharide chain length determinant protein (PEP-CTERM system associated)
VEDRLPAISAQILSRSRLELVIQEFALYPELTKSAPMEDVVSRMRADIAGPNIEGSSRESFRLSYSSGDPAVAQKVTSRLASLYLEQNQRDRTYRADSTSLFIESELENAKRSLVEHEKKLEAFRLRYAGQLPSQLAGNQQVIQSTQLQLQNLWDSMNRAKERRLQFERQLAEAQMPHAVAAAGGGKDSAGPQTAAQELEAARTALERAKRRYTSEYPQMAELERNVRMWQQRAEEEARIASQNALAGTPAMSAAEAQRQRHVRDLEAELDVIDRQIAEAQASEQRLNATLALYKANVDSVPTRESELTELNRGYDVLKAAHDSLLLKREESRIAANLERREIGEQFSVIDRASFPETPSNQRTRFQVMAAGPLAGLALGLLLLAFLEYRDATFRSEEDVFRSLNLPVLALVPAMSRPADVRKRRLTTMALDALSFAMLAASVMVVVLWRAGA